MKCLLILFCLPAILFAEPLTLSVDFTDIQTTNGALGVLLFDSKDGFPDDSEKAVWRGYISVSPEKTASIQLENLEPGTYAVSVFQDLNGNQKCDTNWMGIPTEPYGFSSHNNKRFLFPRFKKAQFELTPANTRIKVTLLN